MSEANKNIVYGLYDRPEQLLSAVKEANADHLDIWDVFSPFPVHGLDPLLGLSESRLHIGGFIFGLTGTLTAFLGITWIFTRDWPQIFGGKPFFAIPAWIPIIFELTVLFSAIGMVLTFFIVNGQGPGVNNPILDKRITDDKFCLAFDSTDEDGGKYRSFLERTGASVVNEKSI